MKTTRASPRQNVMHYRPGWVPWQRWEARPEIHGPLRLATMAILGLIAVLALLLLAGQLW